MATRSPSPQEFSHPEPYIVQATATHRHTLILFHGTSSDGPSFGQTFLDEPVCLPEFFPDCKFIFPSGAAKPTTVFGGKITNAWFDISTFSDRTVGEMDQIPGIKESVEYLTRLVKAEVESLEGEGRARSVVLVGFSQGCAMGLMLLLTGELERAGLGGRIGGFFGMSGWLPFRRQIVEIVDASNREVTDAGVEKSINGTRIMRAVKYVREILDLDGSTEDVGYGMDCLHTPIFLGHGDKDLKVRFEWGEAMQEALVSLGIEVILKSYPGLEHWYEVPEEIEDLVSFLKCQWARKEER